LSGLVDADDVAAAINSSIAALDLANTYQAKGDYLVADDISTFITSDDISTFVSDTSITTNYYQKGAINDMLEVISNSVNQLSSDISGKVGPNDISTFIDAAAVSAQINSSINALDLANTYQAKGNYLVANDISTFITGNDISTFITAEDLPTDHVQSSDVLHIVKCSSTEYANIQTKDNKTLYIVTD
jgi:hypothetical protein